jgi:hypothetical protein
MEALTKQNGVRLLGKLKKFKKKVKTDLPYRSFYKKKPETHIYFFGPTADSWRNQLIAKTLQIHTILNAY